MAVQQNKKSPSRRGQRRSHDAICGPTLSKNKYIDEVHLRHHMTVTGYNKDKQYIVKSIIKQKKKEEA